MAAASKAEAWPPKLTEDQNRDATMLAHLLDFVGHHVVEAPVGRTGRLVHRRLDLVLVDLRKRLGILLASEARATKKGSLSKQKKAIAAALYADRRAQLFSLHGPGRLSRAQERIVRTYETLTDANGNPVASPTNAAAELIQMVYGRSRKTQDLSRAHVAKAIQAAVERATREEGRPQAPSPEDPRGLVRFFVGRVLALDADTTEAVIDAIQRERESFLRRITRRGNLPRGPKGTA